MHPFHVLTNRYDNCRTGINLNGECKATCSRYDLIVSGEGLKGQADSFFFAYRVIDLNEQPRISIVARLEGINNLPAVPQDRDAIAGVMIRKFGDDADNRVLLQSRKRYGAAGSKPDQQSSGAPPQPWLRLSCEPAGASGSFSFQADIAVQRNTWQRVGNAVEIPMDGRVMVGLAATSQAVPKQGHIQPKVQARFSDVSVTPAT